MERVSRPIESAAEVVRGILGPRSARMPAIADLIDAVRTWETIHFEVPIDGESDGFLFQYCAFTRPSGPGFLVSFVRQFERCDADGEHEAFSQVSLEYDYPLDGDLDSLADHHSWWFRSDASPFTAWLNLVEQDLVWEVLRSKEPAGFEISQEWV